MVSMIVLSVGLKLIQEAKADSAAAKLKAMISVTRDGAPRRRAAGDRRRAARSGRRRAARRGRHDSRRRAHRPGQGPVRDPGLAHRRELPRRESSRSRRTPRRAATAPIELTSIAFLGTSVESGSATAVVVATGKDTYLGGMAESLQEQQPPTAFDRGIARFTWLMLRFMLVMVPLVFVINGLTKGNWGQAFFFAVAVAVGLTPEMLPMIVTVCLSKGAVAMGRKKVIVKRINAIQNLGAMDVLCTDKTGTLTMDQVILERHCDVVLREDEDVLALAYLNSHFQTGLKNVLDRAVLAHDETHAHAGTPRVRQGRRDPLRLPASHHVGRRAHARRARTASSPRALRRRSFPACASFELDGALVPLDPRHIEESRPPAAA